MPTNTNPFVGGMTPPYSGRNGGRHSGGEIEGVLRHYFGLRHLSHWEYLYDRDLYRCMTENGWVDLMGSYIDSFIGRRHMGIDMAYGMSATTYSNVPPQAMTSQAIMNAYEQLIAPSPGSKQLKKEKSKEELKREKQDKNIKKLAAYRQRKTNKEPK